MRPPTTIRPAPIRWTSATRSTGSNRCCCWIRRSSRRKWQSGSGDCCRPGTAGTCAWKAAGGRNSKSSGKKQQPRRAAFRGYRRHRQTAACVHARSARLSESDDSLTILLRFPVAQRKAGSLAVVADGRTIAKTPIHYVKRRAATVLRVAARIAGAVKTPLEVVFFAGR